MTDVGFQAIGGETMRENWPIFAAGAVVQAWLVIRSRRSRHFPVRWIAPAAIVATLLAALLGGESFLTMQLAYQTVGEGARADFSKELDAHLSRSWPPLAGLVVLLFVLAMTPRSRRTTALLTAGIGILVSWTVAMWLFVTNHGPVVFRVLVMPGGLGVVASIVGFTASSAMWMATARYVWLRERSGRPSRPDVRVETVEWPPPETRRALPEGKGAQPEDDDTR